MHLICRMTPVCCNTTDQLQSILCDSLFFEDPGTLPFLLSLRNVEMLKKVQNWEDGGL